MIFSDKLLEVLLTDPKYKDDFESLKHYNLAPLVATSGNVITSFFEKDTDKVEMTALLHNKLYEMSNAFSRYYDSGIYDDKDLYLAANNVISSMLCTCCMVEFTKQDHTYEVLDYSAGKWHKLVLDYIMVADDFQSFWLHFKDTTDPSKKKSIINIKVMKYETEFRGKPTEKFNRATDITAAYFEGNRPQFVPYVDTAFNEITYLRLLDKLRVLYKRGF